MKKLILFLFCLTITSVSFGQKFKFSKISRDVKKEAKKYEKENWRSFAGSQPITMQLNGTFNKESEVDEKGVAALEIAQYRKEKFWFFGWETPEPLEKFTSWKELIIAIKE